MLDEKLINQITKFKYFANKWNKTTLDAKNQLSIHSELLVQKFTNFSDKMLLKLNQLEVLILRLSTKLANLNKLKIESKSKSTISVIEKSTKKDKKAAQKDIREKTDNLKLIKDLKANLTTRSRELESTQMLLDDHIIRLESTMIALNNKTEKCCELESQLSDSKLHVSNLIESSINKDDMIEKLLIENSTLKHSLSVSKARVLKMQNNEQNDFQAIYKLRRREKELTERIAQIDLDFKIMSGLLKGNDRGAADIIQKGNINNRIELLKNQAQEMLLEED